MIIELAQGVSLLIALSFIQGLILRQKKSDPAYNAIASGLLFGGVCVLAMMAPLQFSNGVIIDVRSVILSMAGLFGGPVVGGIAALIAGSYRISLGGIGAPVGVAVIVVCVLLGMGYRFCREKGWLSTGLVHLFLFGIVVHLICLALFLFLPDDIAQKIIRNLAVYYLLIFAPATVLLGYLLRDLEVRLQTEEALKISEDNFKRAADTSPLGIYMSKGVEQKAAYVNSKFTELFGYTLDEVPSAAEWWPLGYPDKAYRQEVENEWQNKVKYAVENRTETPPMETVVTCKDGTIKNISWSFVSTGDQNWAFALDLTERKQSEELLRRSQKMEAVGQLTGGIAHDFNNILGIIMGNLEYLQEKLASSPDILKHVENAYKGSERGVKITRKLLMFTRQGASKPEVLNINDSIQSVKQLLQKSITPMVKIETNMSENLWQTNIDSGDFEDTIINLSLNARDAMPEGGNLMIATANKVLGSQFVTRNPGCSAGEYVMVSVSDNGTGMSEAVLDKVFQPFFSTKDTIKGTGLGLSMVYGFVQRYGGYIKASSRPGEGSTFYIYLPRATDEAIVNHEDLLKKEGQTPHGSETILIVDDEESLLNVAESFLESLDYTVLTANSGKQALETIKERGKEIDLVFSDIVMPDGIDGYVLGTTVLENYPDIKLLLTSGFSSKRENINASQSPILATSLNNILDKPYSRVELAKAVRQVLDDKAH